MLGYSEKRYGCRGLTLDKHWDSQCLAMKHSIRKQRPLLLVLEAWGPEAVEKHRSAGDQWCAATEARGKIQADSSIIHLASQGTQGWSRIPGVPARELLPWNCYQGNCTKGLLPWHDMGSNQAPLTQVTPQSPWEGLVSLLQHRAGSGALGCFMRVLLWGMVSEGAGVMSWDNTGNIWGIHPSQFTLWTFIAVCVWSKLLWETLLLVYNLLLGWVSKCFWQQAGQVLLNLNDLFTQNPKGWQWQPRAKQFLNLTFSLAVTKQHIPYWGISLTWWSYFESMTGLKETSRKSWGLFERKTEETGWISETVICSSVL